MSDRLDSIDHTALLTFTLHALPDAAPTEAELRAALVAEAFDVLEGAAAEAQQRIFGEQLLGEPAGFSFRADPHDETLPLLFVFAPLDYSSMPMELEVRGAFAFSEYTTESITTLDAHVWSVDEERAKAAIERVAHVAERLGLVIYVADNADEDSGTDETSDEDSDDDSSGVDEAFTADADDFVPATRDVLTGLWREHAEDVLDAQAISDVDGSVDAQRLLGLVQQSFPVPGTLPVLDLDVRGERVAVLLGALDAGAEELWIDGAQVPLPDGVWGEVLLVPGGGFVLVGDAEHNRDDEDEFEPDVAVYDARHRLVATFAIAAGGEPTVTNHYLVLGFSDERILEGEGLASNGIVAYDLTGKLTLEYQAEFGDDAVDITDCYAMVHTHGDQIACYLYSGFPIVVIDLATNTQFVHNTPRPRGFHALSMHGDIAWLHGAYTTNALFRWQVGAPAMEAVGMLPNGLYLRGIDHGRFLAWGERGYTIFTPER